MKFSFKGRGYRHVRGGGSSTRSLAGCWSVQRLRILLLNSMEWQDDSRLIGRGNLLSGRLRAFGSPRGVALTTTDIRTRLEGLLSSGAVGLSVLLFFFQVIRDKQTTLTPPLTEKAHKRHCSASMSSRTCVFSEHMCVGGAESVKVVCLCG